MDTDLGTSAAKLPWVARRIDSHDAGRNRIFERSALETLHHIASADIDLAKLLMNLSWVVDGVTYFEFKFALPNLADLATTDIEIARRIASFSWYADDSLDTWHESVGSTVESISRIAASDIDLARKITGLSWFADRITHEEWVAVLYLSRLAASDMELTRKVAGLSWFVDDVTDSESAAIRHLANLADSDIEFARRIGEQSWFADREGLDSSVLVSLAWLASLGREILTQLTDQPWFTDGLDEEEAALVVTLGWLASRSPALYAALTRTHSTRHGVVSLPLAGDVNIWVFQHTPFPQDEDLVRVITDTARISERFLGVPFPATDIILLVVDEKEGRHGFHAGTYMVLARGSGGVRSARHETAHYYFSRGPQWLREGGSEFIDTYVKDRTGIQSISNRRTTVSQQVRSQCFDLNGVENIRHYIYIWDSTTGATGQCPYYMGEDFLLNLFETIGEEAMASALRELYPLVLAEDRSGWEDDREEEEVIFDTFLKHTPPELQESFRDLYHRLHGGPYAYPVIDASDDHGDDAAAATEVAVGEVAEGVLDYHFDFDYFKFRAEEGQRYRIRVDHESLRSSSVRLYGSDGRTHERFVDKWTDEGDVSYWQNMRLTGTGRLSYGSQMRWTAPSSGDYYLAVHNFGAKSGRYTLEFAPITTTPDDHGDSKATATAILVGEVVDGIVDYDFDLDFFRLQAVAAQEYLVRIETETRPFLVHVRLYASDGITPTDELAIHYRSGSGTGGGSYHWVAPSSGEYYFAAGGGFGLLGAYRLIIAESDSPRVDLTP